MKRIALLNKLTDLERRQNQAENLRKDIDNSYFTSAEISVNVETSSYKVHGNTEPFKVERSHILKLVESEVDNLEIEIQKLLKEVMEARD